MWHAHTRAIVHAVGDADIEPIKSAQIGATFIYECGMRGSTAMAYPPVVAGGERALTLHYLNNDLPVADGQVRRHHSAMNVDAYKYRAPINNASL